MDYKSNRNQERRPSIQFSEAGIRMSSVDQNVNYLQKVIEYEMGPDISSNLSDNTSDNTVPDTRITYTTEQPAQTYERPAQIFDNPTQTFEQPAQIYEQPVNDAIEVISSGESEALAAAHMMVEQALRAQEGGYGN